MIDDCNDCESNCCKVGPGPYRLVDPEVFLENHGCFESYNMKCDRLINGKCIDWESDSLPLECKTFVCSSKKYTVGDLERIGKLTGRRM